MLWLVVPDIHRGVRDIHYVGDIHYVFCHSRQKIVIVFGGRLQRLGEWLSRRAYTCTRLALTWSGAEGYSSGEPGYPFAIW